MKKNSLNTIISICCFLFLSIGSIAQVTLEKQIKISDKGLFFSGNKVASNAKNNGTKKYDYFFGNRITPHGDCIKTFNGFVFMTWYRGDKNDRHVMLSRYNTKTGVTKTIEFPHRHTGYLNRWWIGESHNTIAIGISPIDGTIHMLYDMHAYDESKPKDGSFANDYFRYTYSKKNAATVSDNQFNIGQFVKNKKGGYKHLQMRAGNDKQTIDSYKSLTYPNFFTNKKGELFMWIREGGNNNGAYKFSKYDGNDWSKFTQFNVLDAKRRKGITYNWGLYGDIKFTEGKMRIGFATRLNNNKDKFQFNNGFHYAYSDDQNGLTKWKDHTGKALKLPILDPTKIKISEPGNLVPSNGANSVKMTSGADWITTKNDDIHFVGRVQGSDKKWINVHTYKKGSASKFTTATNFPGGNLYTFNGDVYLIGLSGGRIFVEKAPGGTNNWKRIYISPKKTSKNNVKEFRHGNVYIDNGKIYFYMMEKGSGSALPIYLQILDLGLDIEETPEQNQKPTVTITSPKEGATFDLGEEITLAASASDPDGNLDKVNFKINGKFHKTVAERPFENTFTPTAVGEYTIGARAFDKEGLFEEVTVTITVQAAVTDKGANDNSNQGSNEDNNSCGFDTPSTSALASFNRESFNNMYVFGNGGPDTRNIRRFRINWNAARNGLYQFAVNTENGVPSHYVDLLDKMTFKFNKARPELTLRNTGLAGWDGSYWVNNDGDNFVMVSKNGGYTIYFTNGAAPDCGQSAKSLLSDTYGVSVKVYPNPATNVINVSGVAVGTTATVLDIQGRIVKTILLNAEVTSIDISELQNGVYFLNVDNNQKTISFVKR